MYCTGCGTQLQDTANYCSQCGLATTRAGSAHSGSDPYAPRRLYRVAYDKKWAGVCAGIAKYMDIDVTLVRIAVVAAFFISCGMVFFAYIAASIIMPVDYGMPPARHNEVPVTG